MAKANITAADGASTDTDTDLSETVKTTAELDNAPPAVDLSAATADPWTKVLIVAGATFDSKLADGRKVIVVQSTVRKKASDDFGHRNPSDHPEIAARAYPMGGDAYLKMDPEVEFGAIPAAAEILAFGGNIFQMTTAGFERQAPHVNVGPASPVYAAANVAWQRGARDIAVTGVSPEDAATLKLWFADADKRLRTATKDWKDTDAFSVSFV